MYTNDSPAVVDPAKVVVDLQLLRCLRRRDELSLQWCDLLAHGGPDWRTLDELQRVEQYIQATYPEVYETQQQHWLELDSSRIHYQGDDRVGCPTCDQQASTTEVAA